MSRDDPDLPLIVRVAQGDESAARALINAKLPRMLALARRMLGDSADAEDIAQETFLRIWRHAARWRPDGARFDTWIHKVTLNLCRDRLRRRRETTLAVMPDLPDLAPSADIAMDEAVRIRMVETAIGSLPERQREAILLVHYQDLTNIAAAQAMDVSVDAIESLLARARRSLRTALVDQESGDD